MTGKLWRAFLSREPVALDFSPPLLRLQERGPNPVGRAVLWGLLGLLGFLVLGAVFGRLDIVAVAGGKLVPASYVKIVQPAESGIVAEILVREGEPVQAGQVLMRMDGLITEADRRTVEADYARKRLALRRIEAELAGRPFHREVGDDPALATEVEAQYRANRAAFEAALAEEQARLARARQDLAAAEQVHRKLADTLPHYREQERAFERLTKDGFAGSLMASDKQRERIEKEQELRTQDHVVESARAGIAQSERRLAQIESDYRRQLHAERNETEGLSARLAQELTKQAHRQALMELKAPQDGIVKDLATHTEGTVVQPGTVLLTLVPRDERLRVEAWVANEDIGFVRVGQPVKIKLAAFPFQKYGMLDGTVEHLSADAASGVASNGGANQPVPGALPEQPLGYKALIRVDATRLALRDGTDLPLTAGMRASAEIFLGTRSVWEFLLSPVQGAWHEAARER